MAYLLQQLLGESAARAPEREAVRYEGRSLSYGELDARSNKLAHALRDLGARRGDRVGIYMPKRLESAAAIYGVMKAGAAYVPLDPFAPPARVARVIADCGIARLVTTDSMAGALRRLAAERPAITGLVGAPPVDGLAARAVAWSDVDAYPAGAPPSPEPIELDLAYILYTSGSTGAPKGIMHTHRSGISFAAWAAREYGVRPEDRLSSHAPLHFDLSTFDFFSAAAAGAATVLIPEAVTKFPADLSDLMARERLTVWYSVPFALTQLLARGALGARDLSALRWVLFAGEPFPTKHLRELMRILPGARFSNLYGPTETNVCTYYHVPPLPEGSDDPIPIGRPCANTDVFVADPDDAPALPGAPGELVVRGPSVMPGYWGLPDMSERAFLRRPSASGGVDLFYRTGDVVVELPGGDYRLIGRKDRQIKTRGYRVELDEIEAALLTHPDVEEAAAFAVPDDDGSSRIEAAAVPKAGAAATEAALRAHVAARLPAYAVPARVQVMDSFPRTSTGKVDRRSLMGARPGADNQGVNVSWIRDPS